MIFKELASLNVSPWYVTIIVHWALKTNFHSSPLKLCFVKLNEVSMGEDIAQW